MKNGTTNHREKRDMLSSSSQRRKGIFLRELLQLNYPPIAISLGRAPPSSLSRLKGKMEFCRMWAKAMNGEAFFVTAENHNCFPGIHHLGLHDWSDKEAVSRFWVEEVHTHSHNSVDKYISSLPSLKPEEAGLICISSLEKASFEPDLVLVRCNPEQAMLLLWAYTYNTGELVYGHTGTAMCSTLVVRPYLTKKPSFSIGDPGGRYIVGLSREEIMASIPYQLFDSMLKVLQSHLEDWKAQE